MVLQIRVPSLFSCGDGTPFVEETQDRIFCIFVGESSSNAERKRRPSGRNVVWRCVSFLTETPDSVDQVPARETTPLRERPAALAQFWNNIDEQATEAACEALESQLSLEAQPNVLDAEHSKEALLQSEFVQDSLELKWQKEPEASCDEGGLLSDSDDEDIFVNEASLRLERCPRQCVRYGSKAPLRFSQRGHSSPGLGLEPRCKQCGSLLTFELQIFVQKCIFLFQKLALAGCTPPLSSQVLDDDVESVDVFRCVHGCGATLLELQ
jgi:hypothetical protein